MGDEALAGAVGRDHRLERLRQAIERAERRRTERLGGRSAGVAHVAGEGPGKETLYLADRDGSRDILQREIVWIEAAKDYALIYTPTRSHIVRSTMSELARRLHPTILRVHRSAFVAASAIRRRTRSERGLFNLLLTDGSVVQVGPSYVQAVRASLRTRRPDLD